MQEGGKLLGQGSYGCVFKPHIRCQDRSIKRIKNGVGKVFENHDEYEQEVKINNLVSKHADPEGLFTLPILAICETVEARQQNDLRNCRHYNPNKQTYDQIIYQYAGKSVKDLLASKGTPAKFWKLFAAFKPVLDGLVKFQELGYVHCDIKPHNLMILKQRMFLIDFGLWGRDFDIYKKYRLPLLLSNNPYYPPEFKLRFVSKKNSTNDQTFQLYKGRVLENYGSVQKAKKLYKSIGINFDNDIQDLYYHSPALSEYTHIASKIDVYSIGMVLYRLFEWCGYSSREFKRQTPQSELVREVKELLKGMLAIDPRKRLSISECVIKYNDILKLQECLKKKTDAIKASMNETELKAWKGKTKHCLKSLGNKA